MKKNLLVAFALICSVITHKANAEQNIQYIESLGRTIPFAEMKEDADEFYAGVEIKPLEAKLDKSEMQNEGSSDLEYVENKTELPDLPCDDKKLKKQIERFIYYKLSEDKNMKLIERRNNLLLARNLQDFVDVGDETIDSKNNYSTVAISSYLRINEGRKIKHICRSSGNVGNDRFENLYIIIYPYLNYYKVVIPNLVSIPEDKDDATFIYNW